MKTPIIIYVLITSAIAMLVKTGIEVYYNEEFQNLYIIFDLILPISIFFVALRIRIFYWITLVMLALDVAGYAGPVIIGLGTGNTSQEFLYFAAIALFEVVLFYSIIHSGVYLWLTTRSNKSLKAETPQSSDP